jgi:hypothetical protein
MGQSVRLRLPAGRITAAAALVWSSASARLGTAVMGIAAESDR